MKTILLILTLVFAPAVAKAQGTLILLIDVSSSLNYEELEVQLDSYANVLTSIPYLRDINIEIILFDDDPVHLSSGDPIAGAGFLDEHPRTEPRHRGITCLNRALKYIEALIPTVPQPVVLDISGDGEANCEDDYIIGGDLQPVHDTLDRIAATGTIVNTLFYTDHSQPHVDFTRPREFYESLTRNAGFSMDVYDIAEFELALYNKIALEIAALD